jgi:hypothetical protein
MNSTQLHSDMENLMFGRKIEKPQLQVAEKAAFLTMAHYLDLSPAEVSGSFTTTSGTPSYDLSNMTITPADAQIDRITSAVWNGSVNNPLSEIRIRKWMHSYYGLSSSARTGTPEAICAYQDKLFLLKAPNETGTVYFTAQMVLPGIVDFPDSYFPLVVELTKMHLARSTPEGSAEAQQCWYLAKQLIKSFKDQMWPKKSEVEKSTHRDRRSRGLNSLF